MKKIFIVNPNAGNGKAILIIKEIEQYCKELNIDYEIKFTRKQGDATEIAKMYKDKFAVVYSVGGDGTINEVINGLAYGKAHFNAISAGTGNDFIKSINEYEEKLFDIDLGKVNEKYFINSASIGIDAEVCANSILMKEKNIPQDQIYNASLLYSLLKFSPYKIKMNGNEQDITLLALTNGKYYGGGFNISPNAKLDDGFLNLVKANKLNRITILPVLLKLLKGNHYTDKNVENYKIKDLTITSDKLLNYELDGELFIDNTFNISVEENALHYYNINDLKCLKLSK